MFLWFYFNFNHSTAKPGSSEAQIISNYLKKDGRGIIKDF